MPRRTRSAPTVAPTVPTPAGTPALVVSPFAAPYRTVTIGMVALVALNAFEALAVTTTMPTVVASLGGLGLYAMVFAGPLASGIVGMVAGGTWSDRAGPVRPLHAGVTLFVLGLVVAGTAGSMAAVVAGRVVQGLGTGMLYVALYVLVARVFPDAVQPRLFAAFAAAWVLPAVVGPAVAGAVAETLGWRWVFLAVPLLAIPALLLLRPALARARAAATRVPTRSGAADRVRLARAVGAGAGLLLLQLGGRSDGVRAALVAVAGVVLLGVTVPRLLPRGTLRVARGLPAVVVLRGLVAAAFFGAEVYLPLLLATERGLSASRAGLALTVGALTWSGGSWLRGRAEGRRDDGVVLRAGAAAIALGVTLAASSVWTAVPVVVGIAGWGVAGLGMGMSYPTLSLLTLRLSAPSEQGANTSALQLNESLSTALALALTGPVFAALVTTSPSGAFLACFATSVLLALVAAVVAGRVPGPGAVSLR